MDGLRPDHLVYAAPDLAAGIDRVAELLGVVPVPGGRHPAFGTRNALVGLGESAYLEILAPDPASPPPGRGLLFRLDELEGPKLVTWAATGGRLELLVEQAYLAGVDLGPVQEGCRRLPDGSLLSWTLTDPHAPREGGVLPFLIDWGTTPHPADALAHACRLLGLRAEHPDADRVRALLAALGLAIDVASGPAPGLAATIRGPNGTVELR